MAIKTGTPGKVPAAKPVSREPVRPPVADALPALPVATVATVAAVESVVDTLTDTATKARAAIEPAALQAKGKTMMDTIKTVTDKAEQLGADMKTRAEDMLGRGKQATGEFVDFNKGNVEALVESGKIAAKGIEKLGQDAADYARRSFEHTTSAFKGMASVKSPTELMKLHSDYVRSSFDMFVAEASRSTEASLKLAGEIAQPLSNRLAVAADKAKLAA